MVRPKKNSCKHTECFIIRNSSSCQLEEAVASALKQSIVWFGLLLKAVNTMSSALELSSGMFVKNLDRKTSFFAFLTSKGTPHVFLLGKEKANIKS